MKLQWLAIVVLVSAGLAGAQQPATRPTKAVAWTNCVTSECHSSVKASTVVHGPVATNHCDACHEVADATKHTFSTARKGAELCTYCHELSVAGMSTVHKPVAQGQCLGCHDPHGSQTHAFLREKDMPSLCGRCHENPMTGKKFLHGPVAQGACDSCHAPHASSFPKLLDAVGSDLCLRCHSEFEPAMAGAKFHHKALDKGCEQCHDAHGSNQPMSLVKAVPDLCNSCHEKMASLIAGAAVKHSAVTADRACLNCHAAHASNVGKMLTELPASGCLKCHQKQVKRADGSLVAGVPEVANAKLHKHGEIKDGQCGGCHNAHGSANPLLLVKPFTQQFYQGFSPASYALCFGCHDVKLAQEASTTNATNFRNGQRNLHYVHANEGTRDKNCRTCHLAHAGDNDRLIRASMKFGKWSMPVQFEKTATGGSCQPGCHARYDYDRVKPVPSTRPSTMPATRRAVPRVQPMREQTNVITWTSQDISGTKVQVPDTEGRPTVLVLLSADSGRNRGVLRELRSAAETGAAYVVVAGGEGAADAARTMVQWQGDKPWPVVADGDHDAARAMGVSGWPTLLILDSHGMEVSRIAGTAELLAARVKAYVAVAGGTTTPQAANQQLAASRPVASASPTTQAVRDLRAARLLLAENRPAEALAYLDRELKSATLSAEAQGLRVEALILLHRLDEAMNLVDREPLAGMPGPRTTILRSKVYIAEERWNWARPLLQECAAKYPASSDAHYLLGKVYEHDQDFARAAEQYRLSAETRPTE
jgi:predicted CXXCH cytochrome family protein